MKRLNTTTVICITDCFKVILLLWFSLCYVLEWYFVLFEPHVRFHIFGHARLTEWPPVFGNSCSLDLRYVS